MSARKWIRILIGIATAALSAFAVGAGFAADIAQSKTPVSHNLRQALDRLQRHYRDTRSFSANFSEEIATVGAAKRHRSGTVSFRKPGRMRWDFAPPEPQTIVSDGETLYSYDPELNQVVETPLKQALKSSSATSLLLGMGNLDRDFNAAFASPSEGDGPIHLKLTAKSGGYQVELGLDPKSYELVTLILIDQLGDVTKVDFTAVRSNLRLADSMFVFKAPAGADIVTAPATP